MVHLAAGLFGGEHQGLGKPPAMANRSGDAAAGMFGSRSSRLTAILAADVAGYSRLMRADEEGTHERLKAHFGSWSVRRSRSLYGTANGVDHALKLGEEAVPGVLYDAAPVPGHQHRRDPPEPSARSCLRCNC